MSAEIRRPLGALLASLSFSRIVIGVLFILLFRSRENNSSIICLILLLLVQLSDHLDGFLARRFSTPSIVGYAQDSLSDKLFQLAAFIAIQREFALPVIVVWFLIMRDTTLFAYRSINPIEAYGSKNKRWMTFIHAGAVRFCIFLYCFDSIIFGSYRKFYEYYAALENILYYSAGAISLLLSSLLFFAIFIEEKI